MGFENDVIQSIDHGDVEKHPVIAQMYERAEQILQEEAVDPLHFVDLYGEENVTRDLNHIKELKEKFEHSSDKSAKIFEAIVYQHIELSEWLGPNAETIRASEFDDLKNGTDVIVEFTTDDFKKHLALGIDVTFGSQVLEKKFNRIKEEIDSDMLTEVKYYESHDFKGSLKNAPRVIVGVEKDTVVALAALWMRSQNAELGKHFAREIIIKEITLQLQTFLAYANSIGAQKAVRSYTQALSIIKNSIGPVSPERREAYSKHSSDISNDKVLQSIQTQLEKFQTSSIDA